MALRAKDFLKDKRVLYVVGILAFLNLIGYIMVDNTDAVILFLIIGILSSFFNKNMIVVCLCAMIFTNLFVGMRNSQTTYREGLDVGNKATRREPLAKLHPAHLKKTDSEHKLENDIRKVDKDLTKIIDDEDEDIALLKKKIAAKRAAKRTEKAHDNIDDMLRLPVGVGGGGGGGGGTSDQELESLKERFNQLRPMVGAANKMLEGMGGTQGLGKMLEGMNGFMQNMQGVVGKK